MYFGDFSADHEDVPFGMLSQKTRIGEARGLTWTRAAPDSIDSLRRASSEEGTIVHMGPAGSAQRLPIQRQARTENNITLRIE